jgi:hypothetical protein
MNDRIRVYIRFIYIHDIRRAAVSNSYGGLFTFSATTGGLEFGSAVPETPSDEGSICLFFLARNTKKPIIPANAMTPSVTPTPIPAAAPALR